ncbi:saccharopine dehydrogenase [Streptomyces antnestii]|uniref:Saccharopine dehydrogenase n=1 Tax=Streptomyces antnestii TaxID=2494256 RepID=A0A3S2W635_9ACTN|nr:saccharopine dehydrogenase NADP-binding domain-containing protein [Streptomyces sp. San01]RVU29029.1 saccharopine dehydrogenase [Streptomyces sp. San01]
MRVSVVGGAGGIGRAAVHAVAGFDEVAEVVVLDRDAERGDRLVARIGAKGTFQAYDADNDDLAAMLRGSDVVISTLGPYTRFGRRTIEAAIEAGVDYVDVNDDWAPTLEALTLGDRAKQADVTAVVGMGASPGVVSVLAMRAVRELDTVDELVTGWALAGVGPEEGNAKPSAALIHTVEETTGLIKVTEDGVERMVPPLQTFDLDYPGIGKLDIRTIGHPEPVTLPRVVKGLRRSVNVMSGPNWWFEHLESVAKRVDAGELTVRDAALILEEPVERPADAPPTLRTPTLWAWAKGRKDGCDARVGVGLVKWPVGRMAPATAIPAAVVAQMLLRKEIKAPGVVTPEEVVPFELLMERLDPFYVLPQSVPDLYTVAVEFD